MLQSSKIIGVKINKLSQFSDTRGNVIHIIRNDSDGFLGFGECYGSEIYPGAIKAWKLHKNQTQNLVVVYGRIRVVLFDQRIDSTTFGECDVFEIGRPDDYVRITIPPCVWQGFVCLGCNPALIINCSDSAHDLTESEVRDLNDSIMPNHLLLINS